MLIDSHVHFNLIGRNASLPDVLARAAEAGVTRCVAVGGSAEGNSGAVQLASEYPDTIYPVVGYDRDCATVPVDIPGLERVISSHPVVAVGETGLDYHYHPETRSEQIALLREMLAVARKFVLPVVLHSRESEDDLVECMREHRADWKGETDRVGVLHCCTGDRRMAARFLELGLYISFSGIVSFRNADMLRDTALSIPDDRLLCETDSPFLAPVPFRGRMNEPMYVKRVAGVLAEVRGQTFDHVEEITARNTCRLFGLKRG